MDLGPTLVGGAVGAVAGMALHLIVEIATGYEAPWFAVIIGLLTGLGVHQANKSLTGRVSYLRGAVAAAIALAAIVGSTPLISLVAKSRSVEEKGLPQIAAAEEEAERSEEGGGEATPTDEELPPTRGDAVATGRTQSLPPSGDFNMWQFVFMAVGTFIAYEFGRGTGPGPAQGTAPPDEPVVMTDPSN